MQYLDSYNIHETFVKVPQSHYMYIHNKVVKFVLSQDRQKKLPNYFQNLKQFCINWQGFFFFGCLRGRNKAPFPMEIR